MTKLEIKLAKKNGTINSLYENRVNSLVRKKYSISQELAILRQRDTKSQDFEEYNAYAEMCKAQAKVELGL